MSVQYVRDFYGVPASRGRRVTLDGVPGRITGASSQLRIKFDKDKHTSIVHPTDAGLIYFGADGKQIWPKKQESVAMTTENRTNEQIVAEALRSATDDGANRVNEYAAHVTDALRAAGMLREPGELSEELRELIEEADELVALWDERGSWTADSPVGLVMRISRALTIGGVITNPVQEDEQVERVAKAIFMTDYMHMGEDAWDTARLDGNNDRRAAFEKARAALVAAGPVPAQVDEAKLTQLILGKTATAAARAVAEWLKDGAR